MSTASVDLISFKHLFCLLQLCFILLWKRELFDLCSYVTKAPFYLLLAMCVLFSEFKISFAKGFYVGLDIRAHLHEDVSLGLRL